MNKKIITKNFRETQKLGENLAQSILIYQNSSNHYTSRSRSIVTAKILCLEGDLGSGKTMFLQGFAKGLGIKEKILSPTFVIYKKYKNFYHIDCYRLNKPEEILELNFKEIISDPKNIVAIEWPERIKKYLPKNSIKIKFKFIDDQTREIILN